MYILDLPTFPLLYGFQNTGLSSNECYWHIYITRLCPIIHRQCLLLISWFVGICLAPRSSKMRLVHELGVRGGEGKEKAFLVANWNSGSRGPQGMCDSPDLSVFLCQSNRIMCPGSFTADVLVEGRERERGRERGGGREVENTSLNVCIREWVAFTNWHVCHGIGRLVQLCDFQTPTCFLLAQRAQWSSDFIVLVRESYEFDPLPTNQEEFLCPVILLYAFLNI